MNVNVNMEPIANFWECQTEELYSQLSHLLFTEVYKINTKLFAAGNTNIVRECQQMFNFELPIVNSWKEEEGSSLMTMINLSLNVQ